MPKAFALTSNEIYSQSMTQDTMKFIFLFLLAMTGINFISAILARWKTGHQEFSALFYTGSVSF